MLTHGSLFSGIGGFDLAADWCEWENKFHCEWNPFGQKVLKHYWPNSTTYEDITKTDFTIWKGRITVLSGGFPCQPYSSAGKRLGKEDERHLWPEMLRAIREISPSYVVGENVLGLTNWNGGLVFEEVCADLEAEGYEVQPFILPAASVNAPHRRDRVWFVATHPTYNGLEHRTESRGLSEGKGKTRICTRGFTKAKGEISDAAQPGGERGGWQNFPTESPFHRRDDGIPQKLAKFVVKDLENEISKTSEENRIKDLPKVWGKIQSPEVWEQIRGLYSLESKEILLQTMQLYSQADRLQVESSPFGEKVSNQILRTLQKHGEFRRSPQGHELEKQREKQYSNSLSFLPHEVALAARRFETELAKFEAWHRNESIKAYGNAIVPQVAYEIFKVINQLEAGS